MQKILSLPALLLPASRQHRVPAKALAKKRFYAPVSPFRLWVGAVLLALNFVALFSYLFGINSYAAKGYEIKQLQNRILTLDEENQKLSLKVSEAASMVAIQSDFLNSNFVSASQARYLQASQYSQR